MGDTRISGAGVIEVRPCSVSEVINDPAFPALKEEYALESAILGLPNPGEKLAAYDAIEKSGILQSFAAYRDGELVGFVAVLVPVIPHYGVAIAVTESLFVAQAHRKSGAGVQLIRRAERHAKDKGSPGLFISAPSESRLIDVLPFMGYNETNRVFMKRFSHG